MQLYCALSMKVSVWRFNPSLHRSRYLPQYQVNYTFLFDSLKEWIIPTLFCFLNELGFTFGNGVFMFWVSKGIPFVDSHKRTTVDIFFCVYPLCDTTPPSIKNPS